jgi:hypothetical protein
MGCITSAFFNKNLVTHFNELGTNLRCERNTVLAAAHFFE